MLPSGALLEAQREGGLRMSGSLVACVNCHRRSGLGARSGLTIVPPIAGTYLFNTYSQASDALGVPYVESMRNDRPVAYTDATLVRAIREGIDAQGHPLSYLMPRFALSDADAALLIRYLKRLDPRPAPGVTDTTLNFATIVTPDADPAKSRAMLDVLRHYFADRDAAPANPTDRRWQLHVWTLSGAPSTWEKQLDADLAAEPVFAVISGIGGSDWSPVRAFCERAEVPCLFPNVEVPDSRDGDIYPIYFSDGVLLEAGLIASSITSAEPDRRPRTVREVYRDGDSGAAGAHALARALRRAGIDVSQRPLAPGERASAALGGLAAHDALVLWLRPADVASLGRAAPPTQAVYLSGLMGGLDRMPLPDGWRAVAHVAYPFDLPERVHRHLDYLTQWAAARHVAIVEPQIQSDTFLACVLLEEALGHVTGTYVRDYLIERIEDTIEQRLIAGYYPRLTLAPGQRIASKGGYVVHFADAGDGARIVADGPWIVP
ncbi:c-type cytochrome [Burkholderia guangdongensis]|uniref:c-type cytochrome n=1 Tax=Burkholderia guangdongensis TaxID=1792500 RepID=UPI001C54A618|nr:cytochrome C [Burkholderia guangdongensis]